jgi:short-subunit dehydrogenase
MKTVLILGAHSDIAMALAHEFAKNGYTPILAARNASRLGDAIKDLEIRHQVKAEAVEFDVLDLARHPAFYAGLRAKPDVTICVVGLLGDQNAARTDWHLARDIIYTNFTGPASILHIVAADYEQRKTGCIIGIGSVAGDRGRQSNYVYGSAKAGFAAFLSGLRNRLQKAGVHVMTVKPGFVRTKMTEGMKLPPAITATPQQVARDIYKAYTKKRDVLYTLWMWRWIMLIIRLIPERIFKKLGM